MPYRTTNLKQSSMFKSRKYVKKIQIVITSVNLETRIEVHRLHKSPVYAYNTRHVKFTHSVTNGYMTKMLILQIRLLLLYRMINDHKNIGSKMWYRKTIGQPIRADERRTRIV